MVKEVGYYSVDEAKERVEMARAAAAKEMTTVLAEAFLVMDRLAKEDVSARVEGEKALVEEEANEKDLLAARKIQLLSRASA